MFKSMLIALCLCILSLPVKADTMMGVGIHPEDFYVYDLDGRLLFVDDRPILTLIGTFEGPDGYDTVYYGSKLRPPKPITEMTIDEVQAWQDRSVSAGSKSSAAGVYQFIRGTLKDTVARAGISRETKFDRFTQDRLARDALRRCGFYKHTVPDEQIGNCLASVWAALPVVSGDRKGHSAYHGVAGNKSLTSVESVMRTVRGRFRDIAYAGELRNYRPTPVEHISKTVVAQTGTVQETQGGIVFSVRSPTEREIAEQRATLRKENYAQRRQKLQPFGGYVRSERKERVVQSNYTLIPTRKINE